MHVIKNESVTGDDGWLYTAARDALSPQGLKYDRLHNILVMMNDLYRPRTLYLYIHALIYAAAVTIKQW